MRFTILGFRQSIAIEKKVSAKELIFLRWFIDFMTTLRMKWIVIDKLTYFWIDNKTVMGELPILGIAHQPNLRRFLRGMVKKKLLKYHLHKKYQAYYMVNHETISELLSYRPIAKKKHKL